MEKKYYMPMYAFLFEGPHSFMSNDAKILYTLCTHRHGVSQKNGWKDRTGNTYILFSKENMSKALNKSIRSIDKYLGELKKAGLISVKRMGLNKPNRIYVHIPKDYSIYNDYQYEIKSDNKGSAHAVQLEEESTTSIEAPEKVLEKEPLLKEQELAYPEEQNVPISKPLMTNRFINKSISLSNKTGNEERPIDKEKEESRYISIDYIKEKLKFDTWLPEDEVKKLTYEDAFHIIALTLNNSESKIKLSKTRSLNKVFVEEILLSMDKSKMDYAISQYTANYNNIEYNKQRYFLNCMITAYSSENLDLYGKVMNSDLGAHLA